LDAVDVKLSKAVDAIAETNANMDKLTNGMSNEFVFGATPVALWLRQKLTFVN